jgi:hypothetical protein
MSFESAAEMYWDFKGKYGEHEELKKLQRKTELWIQEVKGKLEQ